MNQRRPTQSDVARRAGVSTAAVSRVLNPTGLGTVRVGPETEARVLKVIAELGYVPNPVARNLAKGRTRLLGVFSFESIFPAAQRDFYYPFLLGVEQEAEARGFDLLLFTSASAGSDGRSIFQDGINRLQLADGSVLLGRQPPKGELMQLAALGYPFVSIGRREVPETEVSYVGADYAAATAEIVRHLRELGHEMIAYIGDTVEDESSADRENGYLEAMREGGLCEEITILRLEPTDLNDTDLVALRQKGVTALLMETDGLGERLETLASIIGWQLPGDLSFAVLGDPISPTTDDPGWTSFHIPREAMGRKSVQLLLSLIDGAAVTSARAALPCTFRPGYSTAPPAQR